MTRQPSFDELPASVHALDPSTSHQAIADHTLSGRRSSNLARVLEEVREVPGCVASELAARTGLDAVEVRRRLTDLKLLGSVHRGAPAVGVGRTRKEVTWWPVAEGTAE